MAETQTQEQQQDSVDTITFRDRTMRFVRPTDWQAAMWLRTANQFGRMANKNDEELKNEESVKEFGNLLDKFFSMILSVFPDDADKTWLEIELIEGRMSGEDLLELVKQIGLSADGEQARRIEA